MLPRAMFPIVLLLLLMGCSAGKDPPNHPKLTLDCVAIRTVDRWRVLDPYHVVIYAPDRSAVYLVELAEYCQPLAQQPDHLDLSAHQDGHLCAQGGDALIVDNQRCVISSVLPYKTSN